MRKLTLILGAGLLVAACALADSALNRLWVEMGTATSKTNTSTRVQGFVEEVQVSVSDGNSTGYVFIAVQPKDAEATAYYIATNIVIASKLWRPRVDGTTIGSTVLTNDPPGRYFLFDDTVSLVVTGSPASVTWNCRIKTSE